MKKWNTLCDFFSVLNNNVDYVVLRNYEEFEGGQIVTEHPDIDILCSDRESFLSIAGSESRGAKKDKIHQKINVAGKVVALDVRHVGDGYYDTRWEMEILRTKKLHNNLCYVMDTTNYYYSLLYHALIQKYKVSEDYKNRLKAMTKAMDSSISKPISIEVLESFMQKNGYKYTYPIFPGGIVNFQSVNKDMIETNIKRQWHRKIYALKSRFFKYAKKIIHK